jgi:hypothetical protein
VGGENGREIYTPYDLVFHYDTIVIVHEFVAKGVCIQQKDHENNEEGVIISLHSISLRVLCRFRFSSAPL